MKINFMSSKDNDDKQSMDSKSNNKEIISSNKTNKIIDELSESCFTRYQLDLED